ncbi:MAG: GNAT family N-acetyltransferase [Anaerolineae bacterium]|nr:GNAT family N-acetyltransferase [Anaerolineae bacterium]
MSEIFFAPEILETETFVVRCYRPGDGPALAEALNASYEHLKTFMDWAKPYTSDDEAEQLVRRFYANYLTSTDFVLSVWDAAGKRLLAGSGFHLRGDGLENRSAEVGMWVRADASGQGLGARILSALLAWGFSEWPWERLAWRCDGRNTRSRRTAEKAGMLYEGCLHGHRLLPDGTRSDTLCFAAMRGEWKQDSRDRMQE